MRPPQLITFVLLLLSGVALSAQDRDSPEDTLDALERRLELGRHEEFLRVVDAPVSRLIEFETDGCSGGLSAGWEYLGSRISRLREVHGDQPPWEHCCNSHDRLYHTAVASGSTAEESFEARKEADQALKACVVLIGGERESELIQEYELSSEQIRLLYQAVANLMYRSVRLGGIPCSGLPWRWGYGWPKCDSF